MQEVPFGRMTSLDVVARRVENAIELYFVPAVNVACSPSGLCNDFHCFTQMSRNFASGMLSPNASRWPQNPPGSDQPLPTETGFLFAGRSSARTVHPGRCPKLSCRFDGGLSSYYTFSLRKQRLDFGRESSAKAQRSCITHDLPEILPSRNAPATQRNVISPSRQRQTLPVFFRTPDCGLSMRFVVARQRWRLGGTSARLIVKVSSNPSRKLAA